MSESFIQVAPDSTGKQLRAILRTVGLNSVLDEVIELSDQSGVLITPLAERDLVLDAILASGLKGVPIIGWVSVNLGASLLPLNNGTVPVSGTVGIGGSVTTTIANTQANNQQMSAPGTFAF